MIASVLLMPFNYSNSDVHRKEDYYVKETLFEFLHYVVISPALTLP